MKGTIMRNLVRRFLARRGYVKTTSITAITSEQLRAAEAFVESWTDSGLASSLIHDYTRTLDCSEAETYAGVFRAFGYHALAEDIILDHTEYDECGDDHHICDGDCEDDSETFVLSA
ncbi:hypothetical protein ABZW10_28480 [Kitasatospora sp. NPDC004723]|uniref:hypothetical protein n=1 Tax=Kitasatospora sp. NPDC004723 TaxID=3154288 RepID=UPI0033A984C5